VAPDAPAEPEMVIRQAVEAFNEKGLEAWGEHLAPDVEYVSDPDFPGGGFYRGRDGVLDYWRGFMDAWDHPRIELEETSARGSDVLSIFRFVARGKGSRIPVDFPLAQVARVRGEEIVRLRTYMDREEAREALGP
jgi:ketosteroid isomerase-like protein